MKRIHLLRVEASGSSFAELIEAVRDDDGRVGWLELGSSPVAPPSLDEAALTGVLRAVAAGPERSVAVKPVRGEPVLRDLLREHFRGCRLVLVTGPMDAIETPRLSRDGDGWAVTSADRSRRYTTQALVRALRRPRPWVDESG